MLIKKKCWNCIYIGKTGQDLRGNICWCLLKNCIVDPDIGCEEYYQKIELKGKNYDYNNKAYINK